MTTGLFALIVAALFTGAAFYINVVEQPARLGLDDRALLAEWKPAYKRGTAMQAPLAVIGFVLGALAWWQTEHHGFLAGGLLMLANWPWTMFAILPTNTALMRTELADAGAGTRALIRRWNTLHGVRTGLGALAVVTFAFTLATP